MLVDLKVLEPTKVIYISIYVFLTLSNKPFTFNFTKILKNTLNYQLITNHTENIRLRLCFHI